MTESKHTVKVTICGNEYIIKGEGNESYIQELAHYVHEKMKEVEQSTQMASLLKVSILTSINLADEIFRLRSHNETRSTTVKTPDQTIDSSLALEAYSALARHIQAALEE